MSTMKVYNVHIIDRSDVTKSHCFVPKGQKAECSACHQIGRLVPDTEDAKANMWKPGTMYPHSNGKGMHCSGKDHVPGTVFDHEGYNITLLDELQEYYASWSGRTDIVLVNLQAEDYCSHCHRGETRQVCAYPTKSGEPAGEAMNYLTDAQKEEAREMNRRLLEVMKEYPIVERMFSSCF